MSVEKIITGCHVLRDASGDFYYPVAVYVDCNNALSIRETCLLRAARADNIEEVFGIIERDIQEITEDTEWPHFVGHVPVEDIPGELDAIRLYHPPRQRIGEEVKGQLVGWHIDYRSNHGKGYMPVVTGNIAFHDDSGRVNFLTAHKIQMKNRPKNQNQIVKVMSEAFDALYRAYPIGGSILVDIVPQGNHLARFSLREYTKPREFTMNEVVVDALRKAIVS